MKRKTNKRKGIFGKTELVIRTPKEKSKAEQFVKTEKLRTGIKDKDKDK